MTGEATGSWSVIKTVLSPPPNKSFILTQILNVNDFLIKFALRFVDLEGVFHRGELFPFNVLLCFYQKVTAGFYLILILYRAFGIEHVISVVRCN